MVSQCESSLDVTDFSATAEPFEGDWIDAAAAIFHRHGFCILLNALGKTGVCEVLETCLEVEAKMLQLDPNRLGCRGAGRYSFGAAAESGHMLHHPAWQHLLQSIPVLWVLKKIWPDGFVICGGGGDFVRGGTTSYQGLHSDLGPSRVPPHCRDSVPMISVNFTIQDITGENGPLRVVPGHRVVFGKTDAPPKFSEEPEVLRQLKLFPLPSGAAIIRDLRLWHGGTPNTGEHTRFLPSVELMCLKYWEYISGPHSLDYKYCKPCNWHQCCVYYKREPCLPDSLFETLLPDVQKLCEHIRGSNVPLGLKKFARAQRSWEDGRASWSYSAYSPWKSWQEGTSVEASRRDHEETTASVSAASRYSQPWSSQRSWSEAKTNHVDDLGSGGSGRQKNWTDWSNWSREETDRLAISNEGIAIVGTVVAKTIRVTLAAVLFVKALRFVNRISTDFERVAGIAKSRLLRALPFLSVFSKFALLVEHT